MHIVRRSSYTATEQLSDGSVILRRSAQPYETIAIAVDEMLSVASTLRTLRGFTGGLVVNGTAVPGRNDPAFEEALRPSFDELVLMARRVGFVMATAPGALQVQRLSGGMGTPIRVFTAEEDALAYVAPQAGEKLSGWRGERLRNRS